jgi:hypothetical protein
MPPGWLHATLTVRGGCLLGVNWTRGSDLHIVANIYAREFKADREEVSHQLLLNSGSMAYSTALTNFGLSFAPSGVFCATA